MMAGSDDVSARQSRLLRRAKFMSSLKSGSLRSPEPVAGSVVDEDALEHKKNEAAAMLLQCQSEDMIDVVLSILRLAEQDR